MNERCNRNQSDDGGRVWPGRGLTEKQSNTAGLDDNIINNGFKDNNTLKKREKETAQSDWQFLFN